MRNWTYSTAGGRPPRTYSEAFDRAAAKALQSAPTTWRDRIAARIADLERRIERLERKGPRA